MRGAWWKEHIVWGVNSSEDIWCRRWPSQNWVKIDGKLCNSVSISPEGEVWGTNSSHDIWYRSLTAPVNPAGVGWTHVDGKLTVVCAGRNSVWGVNANDDIWFRTGVSEARPTGTGWQRVQGNLRQISVGASDQVWGVTGGRNIFYRYEIAVVCVCIA